MIGLTNKEVEQRIANGQINKEVNSRGKSIKEIVLTNTINYFNILNIVLGILIFFSGQIKNMLFLFVIVINTLIAIIQEIKSKKMIDKLTFLTRKKITVLRENTKVQLEYTDLVVDDIFEIEIGDQIPVDSILVQGSVEVDESNLTGESDYIVKEVDSFLYSGSFVVSGNALLKVKHVGSENYINKILAETKASRIYPSKLRDTLNNILKLITVGIIPIGILLFLKNHFINQLVFEEVILKSVAPLIGMIPDGLILLTSVTLSISAYKLATKKILVQELYCIETLARVDTLCVDKTGTITEGKMKVQTVIGDIDEIMRNYLNAFSIPNSSEQAMIEYFGKQDTYELISKIDFSSKRKYSCVAFKKQGSFYVGAYQFLIKNQKQEELDQINFYTKKGYRVLVVAKSEYGIIENYLPDDLKVIGYIILSDVIRKNTKKLFDYFQKEKIDIKVISGDNHITVNEIAKQAGLANTKAIDVSKLNSEELKVATLTHNIFGRVSPEQKKEMVKILQENKHTVAMTGDGVNDVLALKQADVSIAMAQGSDAAKQIANIVLLENDFQNLFDILMEGRRVINNIQKVSTLFLTKTIFSMVFALISIVSTIQFPFIPIQLTLISALTIGIPSFFITFEKNKNKVQDNFMETVLKRSGFSASIFCLCVILLSIFIPSYLKPYLATIATYCALWNGIVLIYFITKPQNLMNKILIGSLIVAGIITMNVMPQFFHFEILNMKAMLFTLTSIVLIAGIYTLVIKLSTKNKIY